MSIGSRLHSIALLPDLEAKLVNGGKKEIRLPVIPDSACPFGDVGDYLITNKGVLAVKITSIRIEKIQSTIEAGAIATGIGSPFLRDCKKPDFERRWRDLYPEDSPFNWDADPEVWVATVVPEQVVDLLAQKGLVMMGELDRDLHGQAL